ncbi:MAG: peptide MFS transporter, partial [Longimicrobiales bacterium]
YILALPGGWVADNLWGQRKSVFVGGCIIALGHFTIAVPTDFSFFLGLTLIIIGTGLLKPNVSTMVGELYPEGGARRDAGFSVFYMGINLGAWLGPLVTSFLGENYNWHWGFAAAGVGMVFGLIQYRRGAGYLGTAGLLKTGASAEEISRKSRVFFGSFFGIIAATALFAYMVSIGRIDLTITEIAEYLGIGVLVMVAGYFLYLWTLGGHTLEENKKMGVIFWLFLMIAVFWSGFEQAGSSLNLFGQDLTNRVIFGWEAPAGWLQSVNPVFIILLAPAFGSLWVWLERRNANPSIPVKAGLGLLGLSMGFFVLAWGAANATEGNLVSPSWLIVTYFLHTVGELAISPIGLSAITKLSPERRVGQMMGIWFVGAAVGNLFAGLVAGRLQDLAYVDLFRNIAMIVGGVGIFALLMSPAIKKLLGKVS